MNEPVTVVAVLISILTLSIIYKHVELTVQIRDMVNFKLRANKIDEKEEEPAKADSLAEK